MQLPMAVHVPLVHSAILQDGTGSLQERPLTKAYLHQNLQGQGRLLTKGNINLHLVPDSMERRVTLSNQACNMVTLWLCTWSFHQVISTQHASELALEL
jgi:hypothetical protein